jgi:hypothetical protein
MQKCNNIWWEKWVSLRPVLLRPKQTAGVVISPYVGPITAVTIIAGKDVQMVLWRGNDWAVLLCLTTWYSEISNTIMTTQKTGSNELAIKSEGFKRVPCLKKGLFVKMTAFWYTVPCSLVELDWHLKGAYCLHHRSDDGGRLHGTISQKAVIFILTTMRTQEQVHFW